MKKIFILLFVSTSLFSCSSSSTSELCTIITEFEELTRTTKIRRQNQNRVDELRSKMYQEITKIAESGKFNSEELEEELHRTCPASKKLNTLFRDIKF